MSFFSRLFGGGKQKSGSARAFDTAGYEGFHIETTPREEGGQFRVCALVRKDVDGEEKTHTLIRADMCTTAQEASDMAMRKARQVIDERGEHLFT